MDNRKQKEEEKTLKYAPLRLELKRQHPGFKIRKIDSSTSSLTLLVAATVGRLVWHKNNPLHALIYVQVFLTIQLK